MAVLTLMQPFTTTVPTLTVENRLTPGVHVFQLVVVNAQGVQSDPVRAAVTVLPRIVPPGPLGIVAGRTAPQAAETVSRRKPAATKKAAVKGKKSAISPAKRQKKPAETTKPAEAGPVLPAGAEKEAAAQPAKAAKARPKDKRRQHKPDLPAASAAAQGAEAASRPGSGAKKKKTSASRKKTRKKIN